MSTPLPTRRQALIFSVKATLHRLLRACKNAGDSGLRRWPATTGHGAPAGLVRGESVSLLRASDREELRQLNLGKIENLRVALRAIDGVRVPGGGVFSFWAQLGRPSARRGYVPGRELREGCVIPSIGGGLCQLSNALYQAAIDAGFEIVERQAHSQIVEGSAAQLGRDATVFWNYVDLRFRAGVPFSISAHMDGDELRVAIRTASAAPAPAPARAQAAVVIALAKPGADAPGSCETCGQDQCFRRTDARQPRNGRRGVVMVDNVWPEFDAWLAAAGEGGRRLLVPLDGKARGKARYGWSTDCYERVHTFPALTLWRALASRMLASRAAVRQRASIRFRQRLARAYVESLHYLDEHIVIAQELLPHVWQLGALQGRSFDVLMSGLPMKHLQARLDQAFLHNPASTTLADFRAPPGLVAAEEAALARARRIITPHHGVAELFRNATLLPWAPPRAASAAPGAGFKIVFPGPSLGRKGAYELRSVARALDLRLSLLGPVLEAPAFWDGIEVELLGRAGDDWLREAAVVVSPSWIDGPPQQLLQALLAGIPVIATDACGLPPQKNLTLVAAGDSVALELALQPYARACRSFGEPFACAAGL
ncbi:VanW family protein [Massilia glaciei]|nr:VanW family protein [Massilia glaciei]